MNLISLPVWAIIEFFFLSEQTVKANTLEKWSADWKFHPSFKRRRFRFAPGHGTPVQKTLIFFIMSMSLNSFFSQVFFLNYYYSTSFSLWNKIVFVSY